MLWCVCTLTLKRCGRSSSSLANSVVEQYRIPLPRNSCITCKSFVLGATLTSTRRPFGHKTSSFDILTIVVDTGSIKTTNQNKLNLNLNLNLITGQRLPALNGNRHRSQQEEDKDYGGCYKTAYSSISLHAMEPYSNQSIDVTQAQQSCNTEIRACNKSCKIRRDINKDKLWNARPSTCLLLPRPRPMTWALWSMSRPRTNYGSTMSRPTARSKAKNFFTRTAKLPTQCFAIHYILHSFT